MSDQNEAVGKTKMICFLEFEKSTKRTQLFREIVDDDDPKPEMIRNIYLMNWIYAKLERPRRIRVTIESED